MTIAAASQPSPTVAPRQSIQFVDTQTGLLTQPGIQFLQQLYQFITCTNRLIPCNATGANLITLTMLQVQPAVSQYVSHDTYSAVAQNTTSGPVTAQVVTQNGSLGVLNVYKSNGSTQATTGDIVAGLHYLFTFVDTLNSGNGGLVLR